MVVDVLLPLLSNLIYIFARYSHARIPSCHIFTIILSRAFCRDRTTAISKGDNIFYPHLSLSTRTAIFLVFLHFTFESCKRKFLQSFCALSKARMAKRHSSQYETFYSFTGISATTTVGLRSSLQKVKEKF